MRIIDRREDRRERPGHGRRAGRRYRDVDLELGPSAAERLGGGAALFTAFPSTDLITIHFRKLEAP